MATNLTDLAHIRVRYATYRDRTIDERSADADRLLALPAAERLLLDTCHRVELISVDNGPPSEPMASGRDAIRRVLEVVAGFDSAVVAEEQLLGQARSAYEAALSAGHTGPILNELLRRALRFGRRVRTHARPGTDRSLADPGAAWLLEHLPAGARVLVAGTGEMGRLAAQRLAAAGMSVTVVSRSEERGATMRAHLGRGDHRLLVGSLTSDVVADHAALVLAVRAREPMLLATHLAGEARPWTLDLSTPSAVETAAIAILDERFLGLDRLGELSGSAPVLAPDTERRLRRELEDEVERFVTWLEHRRSGDALALLHGEADAVRRRHLDRLRRRGDLAPEQLAAVEAAASAMVGELLHRPFVELKRGGADADLVRRLFGIDA